jgi:hypothetical protein
MVTDNRVAWEKRQRGESGMNEEEELSERLEVLDAACAIRSEYGMQKEEETKVKLEKERKLDKAGDMHMMFAMHGLNSAVHSKGQPLRKSQLIEDRLGLSSLTERLVDAVSEKEEPLDLQKKRLALDEELQKRRLALDEDLQKRRLQLEEDKHYAEVEYKKRKLESDEQEKKAARKHGLDMLEAQNKHTQLLIQMMQAKKE